MQLGFLAPLYERPGPWASVYLGTDRADEAHPGRRELQARAACRELSAQGADEATGQAVYEALIAPETLPGEAGRAVFAAGGEVVLDPVLTARPPGNDDVTWSAVPRVAPLLDLAEQEPVCLVAYIDRQGADLEVRSTHGHRSAGRAEGRDWPLHRSPSADWSEQHFQQSVENTWDENAATTAAAVAGACDRHDADLVVLAGDLRQRRAVHRKLPAGLHAHVVETEHGSRSDGGSRLLDKDVERARADRLHQRADDELDRYLSARDATAEGVPALVEAAREHRIAALFVRPEGPDGNREVWVGDGPDQLAVRRTESQYLGEVHPSSARADDALIRSAVVTNAEVLRVPPVGGHSVPVGGLGALLRWPYQDEERA